MLQIGYSIVAGGMLVSWTQPLHSQIYELQISRDLIDWRDPAFTECHPVGHSTGPDVDGWVYRVDDPLPARMFFRLAIP